MTSYILLGVTKIWKENSAILQNEVVFFSETLVPNVFQVTNLMHNSFIL